jgi:serine/threonine-protein kinase PknK
VVKLGSVLGGRYRILRPLGRGGMAQAFVARDLVDDEEVALKVLRDARLAEALHAEFERVREQVHPCLLRVRELSRAQHGRELVHFYSADLVPGQSLAEFAESHDLAASRETLGDVLEALHVLHGLGVRHGDVKPDNVIVRADGRAVLIDLGCAAPLRVAQPLPSGTPGYMSPELMRGEPADERADLFAFGVMLRELYGGQAPPSLVARLGADEVAERPASASEVIALLGIARDVDRYRFARPARLLGRDAELARAMEHIAGFARDEPGVRVLWVHGPEGVGRSRFLRELAFACARDLHVLEARARAPQPLRAALARVLGDVAVGPEGFLVAAEELIDGDARRLLLLDDADLLAREARDELDWLMRSLPASGKLFMLVASREPPPEAPALSALALAPLSLEALGAWAAGLLSGEAVPRLRAHTGGFPRDVEATLAALAAGRLSESDLGRAPPAADARREHTLSAALAGLEGDALELLARILVWGKAHGAAGEALLARGLVRLERSELVLAREADRAPLARLLDTRLMKRLHAARARELSSSTDPHDEAAALGHLLGAGEIAQAHERFERAAPRIGLAPRAFVRALSGHEARLAPGQLALLARAARLSAEPRRALSLLARGRRQAAELRAFWIEAAEAYLAVGRLPRARRCLERIQGEPDATQLELATRLCTRLGDTTRALAMAEQALALSTDAEQRARVLEALALAEAYLGRDDAALEHVSEAARLHDPASGRALARCAAFRGFVLLRAGRVSEAAEACGQTLRAAEQHGFADLMVNALTNLGNTRHMMGRYGSALSAYERALRLARALGRRGDVRLLGANLANLALEVGSFARAEAELARLGREHREAELPVTVGLYRAELALLTGSPRAALDMVGALSAAGRDETELWLLRGQAELALGALTALEATLAVLAGRDLSLDLAVRHAELAAELALVRGDAEAAVRALEAALSRARPSGLEPLLARLEGALARACTALGLSALASEHRTRARARWERMALDLAPSLRDAFWAHPFRRDSEPASEPRAPAGRTTLSLSRLLDINRRINSSLSVTELLDHAMDAAIELTLAERGFVLLRDGDALSVAAARHFTGAQLKRKEHKLSRSIAERVLSSGEPLWTVDAGEDQRFARQASVHAMRLKSVLCVPIRGEQGVIGALYLDNRLERARFAAADAELLLAFADQVAIALRNARLLAELEQQSKELAREKRKVEELLRGKTAEVERLEQALSQSRAVLETRYDYAQIVGRSEPMRRVLSVLDRVVESEVNVLVTGESGTGKELVARAIHANGPRKAGPFVAINCAALPENLLEAELFGHVKGAFTGAERDRDGLFRAAAGGTLFLDELGELPFGVQAKLLRVLADREVRPLGSTRSSPVDVRLVCATNRDLPARVRDGAFREDLYYRVAVISVALPALRERSEDIVPIAEALLEKRARELGEPARKLAPDAVRALLAHPWPGNVRELENTLLRASVLAAGNAIAAADLGLGAAQQRTRRAPKNRKDYEVLEAQRLLAALEAERWNVSRVARNLGIPRNTLYRKLERYGIRA